MQKFLLVIFLFHPILTVSSLELIPVQAHQNSNDTSNSNCSGHSKQFFLLLELRLLGLSKVFDSQSKLYLKGLLAWSNVPIERAAHRASRHCRHRSDTLHPLHTRLAIGLFQIFKIQHQSVGVIWQTMLEWQGTAVCIFKLKISVKRWWGLSYANQVSLPRSYCLNNQTDQVQDHLKFSSHWQMLKVLKNM